MILLCLHILLATPALAIMITKECPYDETRISCSFYKEYTCWEAEDRLTRVKAPSKKLGHCWSGCVCRKGTVRAYPSGPCVRVHTCRDRDLAATILKLPPSFDY